MDSSISVKLNREDRKALSTLAQKKRISISRLIHEWIEKGLQKTETTKSTSNNTALEDLLSSVILKKPYIGVDNETAVQKIREGITIF